MPVNKNAFLRYNTLDKCFSNFGRKYYIEDLLEICSDALLDYDASKEGVKRRQLFNDIRFMKSEAGFAAPIIAIYEDKRPYYRYEDKNFSISQRPMNTDEAEIMRAALTTLSRFKGLPQFEWINEIIPKIESNFQLSPNTIPIISFQANEYLQGLEFLNSLYKNIINKNVIEIQYRPFNKPVIQQIVHPYYLKQYNNRWFLLGYNDSYDKISIFALDRIENVIDINKAYRENVIDFEEYFEDIIGVTIPEEGKIVKIILRFSNSVAPYITTNPLHGSQKQLSKNGMYLFISLSVIPNYELKKLILSFGADCTIIEPMCLKEEIKDILDKEIKNYQSY